MDNDRKPLFDGKRVYYPCPFDACFSVFNSPLSTEQLGILWQAITEYAFYGSTPKLNDALVEMAFSPFKFSLDKYADEYKKTCDKNRGNANKRWHPTECDGITADNIVKPECD